MKVNCSALGVLRLTVLPSGVGVIEVWKKADPSVRGAYVAPMPDGLTFQFRSWMYNGTSWLDNYQEFDLTAPAMQSTTYQYDFLDRLTRVTDTLGVATVITYNTSLGQKTAMNDPDMGVWQYVYNEAGNLTRQIDARLQRVCFYYDVLNRPTGRHYNGTSDNCPALSGSTTVRYGYDLGSNGIGRRTHMTDTTGSTAWVYGNRGRMTSETKIITGAGTFYTQWAYDAADRLKSTTYPGGSGGQTGEVINSTYTAGWFLNTVTSTTGIYVGASAYDAAGRLDSRTLGTASIYLDYVYNPWTTQGGRLQQIKAGISGQPTSLQDLRYAYDAVGNVLTIADHKAGTSPTNPQTQTFTYDSLDRLLTAGATGGTSGNGDYATGTYAYGPTGNITSMPGVGVYTYTASASGCALGANGPKPHAVSGAGSYTFAYDCNGNMLTRVISGTTYTLSYDPENHMTATVGTGVNASFSYDGDGNRVKGTVGGVTTVYVGSHYERNVGTGVVKLYYYAGAQRVAMRDNGTLYYLLGDHLGSTSITANSSGGFVAEVRYMPFGRDRYASGTTPTTYRFTGQRHDAGLGPDAWLGGLYFYNARWYNQL